MYNGKIIPEELQKEAVLGADDPASFLNQLAATSLQRRAAYIPNTDERTFEHASQELGRFALQWHRNPKGVVEALGAEKLPVPEFEMIMHQFGSLKFVSEESIRQDLRSERRRQFFAELHLLRKTRRWLPLRRMALKRLHPDFWYNLTHGDYYKARINGVVYPVKYNMKVERD